NIEASFLTDTADLSEPAQELYQEDRQDLGYVMNASRLWAHLAEAYSQISDVAGLAADKASLSKQDRGILVLSTTSTLGSSYCSRMWGKMVAEITNPEFSADLLRGGEGLLDVRERALAQWARQVVAEPNAITAQNVQTLRDHGYGDGQILAITIYV